MKFHSISSRPLLKTSSSCLSPACNGEEDTFAAAAKGLLELKRFWVGERKEPVEAGERLGERLGVKLSGSDANAGAGGARSMSDSGNSGSAYRLAGDKMWSGDWKYLGRRVDGGLAGHDKAGRM